MKKIVLALTLLVAVNGVAQAQSWQEIFNKAKSQASGSGKGGSNSGSIKDLSNTEIVNGLKEALRVGANNASRKLSATNGFFGNALIKVLMPPEAKQVEATLRKIGMGSTVDKAILAMNRAAEDASKKAVPIFVDAIAGMSIQDGLSILTGGNNAATTFLRNKTTNALTAAFKPVISNSLSKVGATAYWSQVFTAYNKLPTTKNKINPDLTAYVTERALNGLFVTIADEEAKIRTNPAARTSSILQKVFGAK